MLLDPGTQAAGSTFVWDDNSTGSTRPVNQNGTYHVTVTNAAGCESRDTISILMREKPAIDLAASGTSFCIGSSAVLDAGVGGQNGGSYYWNTGALTQTITVTSAGTYIAFVTSNDGCANSDTVTMIVDGYAPTNDGIHVTALASDSFTFSAINPQNIVNYEWDFGDGSPISISASPTHKYNNNGQYVVKMKSISTCADDLDSAYVNIFGLNVNDIDNILGTVQVYPNPYTQGLLNIHTDKGIEIISTSFINLIGQSFGLETQFEKGREIHQIQVPKQLVNGMYLLKIETNKGIVNKKIEIRR